MGLPPPEPWVLLSEARVSPENILNPSDPHTPSCYAYQRWIALFLNPVSKSTQTPGEWWESEK